MTTSPAANVSQTPEASSDDIGAGHVHPAATGADEGARDPVRDVMRSGWTLAAAWLVLRALMLAQFSHKYTYITGDPRYYNWELSHIPHLAQRMPEYPVPVVWFLGLFHWMSAGSDGIYSAAFAAGMAVLDAGFTLLLWRHRARAAAWFWMAFGFLMGPLLWFRFDVLPAVVVGAALLLVARRPAVSGALVGLGAAIKLWPALILLPLLHRDRAGRGRAVGFAVAGGLLALASWAAAGTDRLFSPLTWQGDRGLQIESLPGSAVVLAWALRGGDANHTHGWSIAMSRFNAFEVYGPGVSTALHLSSLLMLLAGIVAVALGVLAWRRGTLDVATATTSAVAIIAAFICANKTLSPQYMFWLGAPLAVLLHQSRTPVLRRRAVLLCATALVTAGLTQVIYPDHYSSLIYTAPPTRAMSLVLAARNLLVLVVAVLATWFAVRPVHDADAN